MPPWIIFDDFEDVPDAKSPFSTRAVFRPRLAASRATPAPVIPPPTTSTSNVSSARRRNASARRKGCTDQDCHILRAIRPGTTSAAIGVAPAVQHHRIVREGLGATHVGSPIVGMRDEAEPQRGGLDRPVTDDGLEGRSEVVDGAGTKPGAPGFLCGAQETTVFLLRLLSLRGEADQLAPARRRVGHGLDAAMAFQPSDAHGVALP